MIDQDEFHTDEFTVVLQPFMENVDVPKRVRQTTTFPCVYM